MSAARFSQTLMAPLERFYATAKYTYMWRQGRSFRVHEKGPIVVIQMGKVGSQSVKSGLDASVKDRSIYHAHFLSAERTAKTEDRRRQFFRTERYNYLRRPWLNQFLLNQFKKSSGDPKWKIVTLTGEPVSRNISAFFENLEVVPTGSNGEYKFSSAYYRIPPTVVSVDDTRAMAALFFRAAVHDSPVKFFDREIRDIFNIDVYRESFSVEKGYEIYSSDKADLLGLRLESLQEIAAPAFKEFLGIENFQTVNRNIATDKVYAPLYAAFKKQIVFAQQYLDGLYNSDYMRTFYSAEEIDSAQRKWCVADVA